MLGWAFDIDSLKSIDSNWAPMGFNTALSFLLSGLIVFFIVETQIEQSVIAQVVLPIAALIIVMLMGTLLMANTLGIYTGIEQIFISEEYVNYTELAGIPSLAAMTNFILVAIAGLICMSDPVRCRIHLRWIGGVISTIGVVAIVGHITQVSQLYFQIPSISAAMALHTAVTFSALGISITVIGTEKTAKE